MLEKTASFQTKKCHLPLTTTPTSKTLQTHKKFTSDALPKTHDFERFEQEFCWFS